MTQDGFYILIQDEKKFVKELALLLEDITLLTDNGDLKEFKRFLNSPFLIEEKKLPGFFELLLKKFKRSNRLIQGGRLITNYLKHDDLQKGERQLKRLIKLLSVAVLDFYAFRHVKRNQVEKDRLKVKALSPEVRPALYHRALAHYQRSTDQLPVGLNRAVHQWEVSFHGHFSLSVKKEDNRAPAFLQLAQSTKNLADLISLIFECEKINRSKIWKEVKAKVERTPLANIYADLLVVKKQKQFSDKAYEELKSSFLSYADRLDDQELLIITSQLINYLHRQIRNGLATANNKIFELTDWQLKPNIYAHFRVLSKTWYLNQISNACALKKMEAAEAIKELHKNRLDEEERNLAILHAEAIILFHKDQYELAYHLISNDIHQYALYPHTDSVRLKCLRLMSALCLVVKDYNEWEDPYELALNDFDVFFGRKTASIQDERFDYYRNMVIIIRKIHNSWVKQGNLTAVFSEILALIEAPKAPHGQSWLRAFLWHFNPESPHTLPVKPFANDWLVP